MVASINCNVRWLPFYDFVVQQINLKATECKVSFASVRG
jgi:hypothetical protein